MACYHPLHGFPTGQINVKTGKQIIKIVSLLDPLYDRPECITIPCGKCIGCRLEYSRQWANRCLLELEYHDSAYFVTLTYNDSHVPIVESPDGQPVMSLRKRDFQLFMKRLRKAFPDDKIRFFMAGEYGPQTFRPHYHAIIYGLHLHDLVPFGRSELGFQYYTSASLQEVWAQRLAPTRQGRVTPLTADPEYFYDPLGFILVANVTWETCAYTARYVMKKLTGKEGDFYKTFGIEPPFCLMSRKPGIARQWYDDHPGLYDYEYINVKTPTGGRKFRPPRYFDKLYDLEYPEEMAKVREARRLMAAEAQKYKSSLSTRDDFYQLEVEERVKINSAKKLLRKDV